MKVLLFILLSLFLFGCTTAPLTEEHTARTMGKGGKEWAFAGGGPGYLSIGHKVGWTDNLDVGGLIEFQGIGILTSLQAKYMLTPSRAESPLSVVLGAGLGSSTSFAYGGPIQSFKISSRHEVSFGLRYNWFRWRIDAFDEQDDAGDFASDIFDSLEGAINGSYSYLSLDVSNTLWLSSRNGLTPSLTGLSGLNKIEGQSFKVGLKFHTSY